MHITDVPNLAHSFAGQRQVLNKAANSYVPFLKPGRKVPSIGTSLGKRLSKAWQELYWQSDYINRESWFHISSVSLHLMGILWLHRWFKLKRSIYMLQNYIHTPPSSIFFPTNRQKSAFKCGILHLIMATKIMVGNRHGICGDLIDQRVVFCSTIY